jgi:hypothetical protein
MKRCALLLAGLTVLATASSSQAGWAVGVGVGPVYGYYGRPCYHGYYGYYRPYPFVIAPTVVVGGPPVVAVQPAPVVIAQPAVVASPPTASQSHAEPPLLDPPPPPPGEPQTLPAPKPVVRGANENNNDLTALNDPSPQARSDAIIALGRSRDRQAVSPITRALREDSSPQVRESAARALGLIGLPASLDALQRAAQADTDRDVRKSAAFAADVIRANMRR